MKKLCHICDKMVDENSNEGHCFGDTCLARKQNQSDEVRKIIKRELQFAQWIGEDGGMVVDGRFTIRGAWLKMRKLLSEDCGNDEAEELKIEDLNIGYFRLSTKKEREEMGDDFDWVVSIKPTAHKVWVYWG